MTTSAPCAPPGRLNHWLKLRRTAMADRKTRAERMARPHIHDVIRAVAEEHGACTRPVQLRKTSLATDEVEQVIIPCGATMASVCIPCAERNKVLRAAQCREGWHLEHEPVLDPDPPDDYMRWLGEKRADLQADRDHGEASGDDMSELDELISTVDDELRHLGVRGNLSNGSRRQAKMRRKRSTRRCQDTPDLPRRRIITRTVGRTYTSRDGKVFRPSMFLTVTCN